MNTQNASLLVIGLVLALITIVAVGGSRTDAWTADEIATLQRLTLTSLPPLPPDPSNAVADSPPAADLGHHLFFDTRLSRNGEVACATCHLPDRAFTDGLSLAEGVGTTPRKSHNWSRI